jgi:hypothetical protein
MNQLEPPCAECGSYAKPFMVPAGWHHHSLRGERLSMWPALCPGCGNRKEDAEPTAPEWAKEMRDEELLERMRGYASGTLPRAIADEVIRRFRALADDRRNCVRDHGG